jgi:hypothetical protein
MKAAWNEIKLKFKEQLRVVGKYDLNKPNEYLVKRRKFQDMDISKDFERRLSIKKREDSLERLENQIKLEDMTLDQLEAYRDKKIKKEESEKKDDIYNKIVLHDIK